MKFNYYPNVGRKKCLIDLMEQCIVTSSLASFGQYLAICSYIHFSKYAVPSYVAVIAIVLGVFVTSVIFRILIQKELRKIKEIPDVEKIKLSTVLYLVGALFILVAGLYILFTNVAIETLAPIFYFGASMPATACVTTAIMYVFWEQKHKKKILSTTSSLKNCTLQKAMNQTFNSNSSRSGNTYLVHV